jgi:hypothetical protein
MDWRLRGREKKKGSQPPVSGHLGAQVCAGRDRGEFSWGLCCNACTVLSCPILYEACCTPLGPQVCVTSASDSLSAQSWLYLPNRKKKTMSLASRGSRQQAMAASFLLFLPCIPLCHGFWCCGCLLPECRKDQERRTCMSCRDALNEMQGHLS